MNTRLLEFLRTRATIKLVPHPEPSQKDASLKAQEVAELRRALYILLHWATTGDRTGNPYCKPEVRNAIYTYNRGGNSLDFFPDRTKGRTMDPNANLAAMAEALAEGNTETATEYAFALRRWLRSGGDQPDWSAYPSARTFYDETTSGTDA